MRKVNVVIVFSEDKKRLLMCRRIFEPFKGKLNFVGGRVESGETELEAAYRELEEETGISKNDIMLTHFMNFQYILSDIEVEAFAGKLTRGVDPVEEVNPLEWVDICGDFAVDFGDLSRFGGDGNILHMLREIELYKDRIFG